MKNKKGFECRTRAWQACLVWTMAAGLAGAIVFAAQMPDSTPLRIYPDYTGVVIPPNIAPLNFVIETPATAYQVSIESTRGQPIEMTSRDGRVLIPPRAWRELLRANPGQSLRIGVRLRRAPGQWTSCDAVTNTIAREEMDGYLVYRLLKPLYNGYVHLGIYQRNLQTDQESVVLHNRTFKQGCLNCHTFLNHQPDSMAVNIRTSDFGLPMILAQHGEVTKVSRIMGYLSWHPSGKLIAFSMNKLGLFFHTMGESRDVFDEESNLGVYYLDSNRVVVPASIAQPDRRETWPAWSPDGRYLYFSSALPLPINKYDQIRYDLMRVAYDPQTEAWGSPETVLSSQETHLSITQPRVSPDGRFLLFCMSAYGNFPVYQPSSDLYLMDLQTRRHWRLEVNSDQSESWHCWSSNSRWIVFSSKRRDGLFARPYFSYVDPSGHAAKPFLLPQSDPTFYDSFIKTYNVPEFITKPIAVSQRDLADAIARPKKVLMPKTEGVLK